MHYYTSEQKKFLRENVKGITSNELTERVNEQFGLSLGRNQIRAYMKNHGLTNGLNMSFKKGQNPWNKGTKGLQIGGKETQFRKGQRPINYKPVGSERVDSKDGYTLIKVQDNGTWPERWRHKHVVLWEKENGPVPEGHAVLFGDGNKENITLENLILVSRGQLATLNKHDLIQNNADLTRTGIVIADLYRKISDRRKSQEAKE